LTRKILAIASLLIVATMLGTALVVASLVPADLPLPTHWGLDGRPDAYSDKWTALMLPAGITAAVSLLFYFLPALEPRREGLDRSQGLYLWGWVALLMMGSVLELALASLALRWPVHAYHLIVAGVGAMPVLVGNQLGKSRSMYMMGLRTPWTLASEDVWMRTHRLAGKLMVAAGLIMIVAAILPLPSGPLSIVMLAAIAVACGGPAAYSFLLWRRERKAQSSE
jgi:uncharacterized membrane protein